MEFQEGFFSYEIHFDVADFDKYDWSLWDDGFLAFSNREWRFDKKSHPKQIPLLLSGDNQKTANGYLMELDLWWAPSQGVFRELVLEREGTSFFVQDFTLCKTPPDGQKLNCYFAKAKTRPPKKDKDPNKARKRILFESKELASIEVVVPDTRLHVFLTTAGEKI